ncbi:HipA N-terminal domain-containing protein [Pelistega suis]|uniref:HipA N-terminal domain-containing protein n=1 Tax=Pelistega suis TaxID=1631957 RepID=UPI00211BBE8F|nr:HipA N-terminal domain-containing protein [Pelistega suis]MCQ9329010.1 HipA N-terminal domain-containing protein [Pelistega suis]
MKDVLHVAMNGELIGQWFKSRDGHTEFHYEDSWLDSPRRRMLSLSLLLTQKVHRGAVVYNFLNNYLLPKGTVVVQAQKLPCMICPSVNAKVSPPYSPVR